MSDILDLLTEIRDSTANSEALLNALASVDTDLLRVEGQDGDKLSAFEDIIAGYIYDTSLPAGPVDLNGTPVPPGKVWKITLAEMRYLGTPPTTFAIRLRGLGGGPYILKDFSPTPNQWYIWNGDVYLEAADYLQLEIRDATLTDNAYMHYIGLQMNAP